MAQDIPVYLFTGFMDSGKTTLVEETLFENNFGDGSKGIIIMCEDGEKEYDEAKLATINFKLVTVEEEEDLRLQNCRKSRTPISRNKFLSSTTAPGGWTSCLRQKCRRAG